MSTEAGLIPEEPSYRLAVPDAWVKLPMDPVGMRSAARAWLLRRYKDLPRDDTARLRRMLEQELVDLTHRPGAEYARMLLCLALDVDRRPVSASCLVSVVNADLGTEDKRAEHADSERPGAVEAAVTDLGENRGVVVVRDDVTRPPRPDEPEKVAAAARNVAAELGVITDPDDPEVVDQSMRFDTPSRSVDVWIPVPDQSRTLLMQFSTSIPPLFDAFTELFLLTASTVQWRTPSTPWR